MSEFKVEVVRNVLLAGVVFALVISGVFYANIAQVSTSAIVHNSTSNSILTSASGATSASTITSSPAAASSTTFTSFSLDTSTSVSSTGTTSSTSLGNCSVRYPNGTAWNSDFYVNAGSVFYLCVRFFYYGPEVTTLNSTSFMQVTGSENNSGFTNGNADSNFTIIAQPSSFQIGGNNDLNEGIVVNYTIRPHANSNGTYMLESIGWMIPANQECSPDYLLTVGNGIPNYVLYGSCITSTETSSHTFDGMSFQCPDGYPCSEIIGSSNETTS